MARRSFPQRGLYVITRDLFLNRDGLEAEVAAAVRGGAAVVQYRAKRPQDAVGEAAALLALCQQAGIPLIINDDIELANAIHADGVHLGQDDHSLPAAKALLGPEAIVGVSCYDSVDRAVEAATQGANYVAFGRFFSSATKPGAPCAHLATLREAKGKIAAPIVAIGGITPTNAGDLLAEGADLLAVIEGVFGQEDPESAAREFRQLWPDPGN